MSKKLLIFSFFLFSCLTADVVITDELKGIYLLGSWDFARKEPMHDVRGVELKNLSFLQRHPEFLRALEHEFIGYALTNELILAIKEEIVQFYAKEHQPLVVVSTPKQKCDKGCLQLVVQEMKLGKVYARGNCYFPSSLLTSTIHALPSEPIDYIQLKKDIAWLNLNPFRRTDAVLKPGDFPSVVDIELVSKDRLPYRVYMGGDNTGTAATNRNRIFFGFNFGKTILPDGQISYQFSSAPNWNLFYAHTASARLPLPWRHIWLLWGGYTQVEPKTHTHGMKNRGKSWQVDTRYKIPIFSHRSLMQSFSIGYDFKETNNEVLYNQTNIYKTNADISQFVIGYELGWKNPSLKASLDLELFLSPGRMSYANKNRFLEQFRFQAKSRYLYFRFAHSIAKKLGVGSFGYDLSGQLSTTNLLPSEQLIMTGVNAVRGFEERILNLDNGVVANFSYQTPSFSLAKLVNRKKRWDALYFLCFFDYGLGCNHLREVSEASFKQLASIGPGIRYQVDRFFSARFDYGVQLWHRGFESGSSSRYNFGMVLSY